MKQQILIKIIFFSLHFFITDQKSSSWIVKLLLESTTLMWLGDSLDPKTFLLFKQEFSIFWNNSSFFVFSFSFNFSVFISITSWKCFYQKKIVNGTHSFLLLSSFLFTVKVCQNVRDNKQIVLPVHYSTIAVYLYLCWFCCSCFMVGSFSCIGSNVNLPKPGNSLGYGYSELNSKYSMNNSLQRFASMAEDFL